MLTKRLELQFINAGGTRATIGLAEPKEDLTDIQVKNTMEAILIKDVFTSTNGDLATIGGARIVSREITDFNVID